MRSIVRNISKKWFILLYRSLNEAHRLGGEVVHTKPFPLYQFSISLHQCIIVVSPVSGTKSIEVIKSTSQWMVGILHSIMPLPKCPRGIPFLLEQIGNGGLIQIHALAPCRGTVYATTHMMPTSQEFCSRGRTNRADIKAVKGSTFPRQGVDIRGRKIGISIQA